MDGVLGAFSCTNVSWAVGSGLPLHTSVKVFSACPVVSGKPDPTCTQGSVAAVFMTELPMGATGTNASNPTLHGGHTTEPGAFPPSIAFPAFRADKTLAALGYVTWSAPNPGIAGSILHAGSACRFDSARVTGRVTGLICHAGLDACPLSSKRGHTEGSRVSPSRCKA
jgi:hypothetical protein